MYLIFIGLKLFLQLFFEKFLLIFLKHISQSGPLRGYDRYSGGHEQQRGNRGAMNSKGGIEGHDVVTF